MDFSSWASGFPGLLWEIEHQRSRLRLLNRWELPLLGADTPRLIKDASFRADNVLELDQPLLVEFWDMLTARQPAAVTFRLKSDPFQTWLLQGWPDPSDSDKYLGMLKEAVLPAAFIVNGAAGTCQLALGQAQYPVLVFNVGQREIVACNKSADDLFTSVSEAGFLLKDIAPGELEEPLLEAARAAIASRVWAGTLLLRGGNGAILSSKVRISPCASGGGIVRIALLNIPDRPAPVPEIPANTKRGAFSLRKELEALHASCEGVDGLMFSDIQSARGRVEVYGVGEIFSSIPWGDAHAYEGTIAQDIERFGLDSLTVEDTLDSIKSIDWAMFIPCGVRSYYAIPFFGPSGLHAVLILASVKAGAFGPSSDSRFRFLNAPFAGVIDRWRRLKK
ncbi:MAG: hypothetical protein IKX79_02270 [Desulfovibrionaceae bacterium]|nr:hypothetical protein [Desulfovibrionaceae bacterium]